MRITIDTDLQVVIVPNSYYRQIDRLNEVITAAGGRALDYKQYICDCFVTAVDKQIITQSEVAALSTRQKKRTNYAPETENA